MHYNFLKPLIDKKIYRQLATCFVLLVFMAQPFSNVFIITDYYANAEKCTKRCENKMHPKMHFNGKCQLAKKLQEKEKNDQKNSNRKANNRTGNIFFSCSFQNEIFSQKCLIHL